MPDSSDIDEALLTLLRNDATLAALVPNGVWMDEAPPGATQFGLVSLVDAHDEPMFGGRAFEEALYLVKCVEVSSVAVKNGKAAAARIDLLLEQGALTIAGYGLMLLRRDSRVRLTEVDGTDPSIRWYHRGGRYQVVTS